MQYLLTKKSLIGVTQAAKPPANGQIGSLFHIISVKTSRICIFFVFLRLIIAIMSAAYKQH